MIGVSIPFLTKTFTAACKENGVAWSEPSSVPEWKERLQSSAMLSLTNKADEVRNGHFHVPSLFGQAGFDGAFKLTRAMITCTVEVNGAFGELDRLRKITRDTRLRAAPVDVNGVTREDLAVEATAGELCLQPLDEATLCHHRLPLLANLDSDLAR